MATSRIALGSVLDTVVKTANSLGSVLDATTKTIGMADAFVTKASTEQKLSYRIDERKFVHNLVREAAQEQAQADINVATFRKQSTEHAQFFDAALEEFQGLFAKELGLVSE